MIRQDTNGQVKIVIDPGIEIDVSRLKIERDIFEEMRFLDRMMSANEDLAILGYR